jgi:hypothetical protein
MIGSLFTYWFLKILLVVVLFFCGYGISYGQKKEFNIYAIIVILFYSTIQGLRWNRGVDYMTYYNDLLGQRATENPEFLYRIVVNLLSEVLRLPYWCGFVLYSFLLIYAVILVLKVYPKAAIWGLPLFYIVTHTSSENIVRQFIAISFVLFAYYAYLNYKKKSMIFFLCCVPMIHTSGFIAIIPFILLALFKIPVKKPWLLIIIYLALYSLWDVSYLSGITDFLSNIDIGDDKMNRYLNNSDRYFTAEGSISNVLFGRAHVDVRSLPNRITAVLSTIIIIYYGFKAQITDRKLQIAFYFAYTAIIFRTIGGDIEMYARFRLWFEYLMPFILGVAIYKVPMKAYEKYAVWAILFINYGFYGFLRQISSIPYPGVSFIWDR